MATKLDSKPSKRVRSVNNDKGRVHASLHRSGAKAGKSGKASCLSQRKRSTPSVSKEVDAPATMDFLTSYFRDLSEHALLAPEEERNIAQSIEDSEIVAWQILLSDAAVCEYVLDLVEARLDGRLAGGRGLRRAAAAARVSRKPQAGAALGKAARKAAEELRGRDLDREHIEAVLGHLEELRVGAPGSRATKLAFSVQSQAFCDTLAAVKSAYQKASRLRNDFVQANLRLVVTMARRYDHGGMPLADLIQEGNLGLMHAVSRFDHRRGLRFSTYACWWIRHAIGRALADKSRAVRIPVHMLEAQQQLQKVQQQLVAELGRQPTRSEVASRANITMGKLDQMNRYLLGQPLSLDRPVHDDDDRAFGDLLADPESEDSSPEEDLTTRELAERAMDLLRHLSPIEADVLRQRFGLRDDEQRTFREIGDQYHLSRERIRQIQNTALGKLKRALERTIL